eukprot:gene15015-biopygen12212
MWRQDVRARLVAAHTGRVGVWVIVAVAALPTAWRQAARPHHASGGRLATPRWLRHGTRSRGGQREENGGMGARGHGTHGDAAPTNELNAMTRMVALLRPAIRAAQKCAACLHITRGAWGSSAHHQLRCPSSPAVHGAALPIIIIIIIIRPSSAPSFIMRAACLHAAAPRSRRAVERRLRCGTRAADSRGHYLATTLFQPWS